MSVYGMNVYNFSHFTLFLRFFHIAACSYNLFISLLKKYLYEQSKFYTFFCK